MYSCSTEGHTLDIARSDTLLPPQNIGQDTAERIRNKSFAETTHKRERPVCPFKPNPSPPPPTHPNTARLIDHRRGHFCGGLHGIPEEAGRQVYAAGAQGVAPVPYLPHLLVEGLRPGNCSVWRTPYPRGWVGGWVGGGGSEAKKSVCTSNRPQISGLLHNFEFPCRTIFLTLGGGVGRVWPSPPPRPPSILLQPLSRTGGGGS